MILARAAAVCLLLLLPTIGAVAAPAFEVVCSFEAALADPSSTLLAQPDGSLIGTAYATVFALSPPQSGGACKAKILQSFTSDDPVRPGRGVLQARSGSLLIAANSVYRLDPPHSGQTSWTRVILHKFDSSSDDLHGTNPISPLVADAQGRLYGTTTYGGGLFYGSYGTVFRLSPPSGGKTEWPIETLYVFRGQDGGHGAPDGANPVGRLLARTVNGVFTLLGATPRGGMYGFGTLFSVVAPPSGSGPWIETTLHDFTSGSDGGVPLAGLIADRALRLYGTASLGGTLAWPRGGVVFRLTPPASVGGTWNYDVLRGFRGGADGEFPSGDLIEDGNGVLFGTTAGNCYDGSVPRHCGTVFKLTPRDHGGALLPWNEIILHEFDGTDGSTPTTALTPRVEPDGAVALYGVAGYQGPTSRSEGVLFRARPARPFVSPSAE